MAEHIQRWRKYSGRYGPIHAGARYLGTRVPFLWRCVGPLVSRPYRMAWQAGEGAKILNLGGGSNCLSGCLTIDVDPRSDTYVDIRKQLPFGRGSIDGIFCEELIEHVSKEEATRLLGECFRVLKSNAVIRITTPDLDWYSSSLLSGDLSCQLMNDIFYQHGHRYLYSRQELRELVGQCGFSDIRHTAYRDEKSVYGYLDSHPERFNHSPLISQYLEARRP